MVSHALFADGTLVRAPTISGWLPPTALCALLSVGCEVLEPEPEAPPPPPPGFVVSTPFPTRSLQYVVVVTADDAGITSAFAVGTDGTILHFDGAAWSRESVDGGLVEDLEGVSGIVDNDGFEHVLAVGEDGVVVRRTGASGSW